MALTLQLHLGFLQLLAPSACTPLHVVLARGHLPAMASRGAEAEGDGKTCPR